MKIEIVAWGFSADELSNLSRGARERVRRIGLRQQALASALRGHTGALEVIIKRIFNETGLLDAEIAALRDIAENPDINILTFQEIIKEKSKLMGQGLMDSPGFAVLENRALELCRRQAAGTFQNGRFVPKYPDVDIGRHLAEQIAAASPKTLEDLV